MKFFNLPGYGNSDEDHWQTYFEKKLDNCFRIEQKSWTAPTCDDWIEKIESDLIDEDLSQVVLITHSLGGIALLHWLSKYKRVLKGAFIVAPPDLERPFRDFNLDSFTPIPREVLTFPSMVVCSSNDHWMTLDRSKEFSEIWGAELKIIEKAGHINPDAGYTDWEEGLSIFDGFLRRL